MPEKIINNYKALEAEERLVIKATEKTLERVGREITRAAAAKGTLSGGTVRALLSTLVEQLESAANRLIAAHVKAGAFDAKEIATRVLSKLDPIANDFLESHAKRMAGALQVPFQSLRPQVNHFFDSLTDRATLALAEYPRATERKIAELITPSWWSRYHNHVYGASTIIGVVLTVLFFVWSNPKPSVPVSNLSGQPASPSTDKSNEGVRQAKEAPSKVATDEARIASEAQPFSPMSINEYFSRWFDSTDLQRDQLEQGMLGKTVIWTGRIRSIESGKDGAVRVILEPPGRKGATAFLDFDSSQRAYFLELKEKQVIRFTGVIRGFVASPFLEKCKLLNVVE